MGMAKELFQAVIRDPSGEVTVRLPDLDRASVRYARLVQSAKTGVLQGEPEPQAEEEIIIIAPDPGGGLDKEHGGGGGG